MNNLVFDESNELFQLALKLINESGRNIFLTGKAGTGKTTFLKHIQQHCWKQMAIVAPTGVAAINAGGVTIHSLFQLPLSIFIPCAENIIEGNVLNTRGLLSRLQMNSQKRKILQEIELLVIDEISMVRCDVLDALYIRTNPSRASNLFLLIALAVSLWVVRIIEPSSPSKSGSYRLWSNLSEFSSRALLRTWFKRLINSSSVCRTHITIQFTVAKNQRNFWIGLFSFVDKICPEQQEMYS